MKILTSCLVLIGVSLTGLTPAFGQTASSTILQNETAISAPSVKRNVEKIPEIKTLHKVSARKTPSGFPVPRYVSLKVGQVNGRTGPSLGHSVAWEYRRRGLPLIVVAETEFWRKVRDIDGDETWIHKPALSGERMVLAIKETPLYRRANDTSRIEAIIAPQALLKLESCNDQGWCKFRDASGHKGWAQRAHFWGAMPL